MTIPTTPSHDAPAPPDDPAARAVEAARRGDVEAFERIVATLNPTQINPEQDQVSPLLAALQAQSATMIRAALGQGADPNRPSASGAKHHNGEPESVTALEESLKLARRGADPALLAEMLQGLRSKRDIGRCWAGFWQALTASHPIQPHILDAVLQGVVRAASHPAAEPEGASAAQARGVEQLRNLLAHLARRRCTVNRVGPGNTGDAAVEQGEVHALVLHVDRHVSPAFEGAAAPVGAESFGHRSAGKDAGIGEQCALGRARLAPTAAFEWMDAYDYNDERHMAYGQAKFVWSSTPEALDAWLASRAALEPTVELIVAIERELPLAKIEDCIERGADPSVLGLARDTAYHGLLHYSHPSLTPDVVRAAVRRSAHQVKGQGGGSLMRALAMNSHMGWGPPEEEAAHGASLIRAADLLLDAGLDALEADEFGRSSVQDAATRGPGVLARHIVSRCAPEQLSTARFLGGTTLAHVIRVPDPAIYIDLAAKGVDLDALNDGGFGPLHLAVRFGDSDLVAALLAAGANPSGLAADGHLPEDIEPQNAYYNDGAQRCIALLRAARGAQALRAATTTHRLDAQPS